MALLKTLLIAFVLFTMLFAVGCSGGNSPVTLSEHGSDIFMSNSLPVGVSDRFPDGSPSSGMGALGIFNLTLNADEISAELLSLRQSALTDVLEVVDITNFLQMAPCSDCAKIDSVSLDIDGNIVVSIGIKHPFPAGDPLKPISGRNRGDLHVFNIEGTIISNAVGTEFSSINESTSPITLINADGYSGYLDDVLDIIYPTGASVHPYILHFNNYTAGNFDASNPMGFASVTTPPPSGNLVMAMGCDYDYQDYVFNIDGTFDFIYAVGCTYAVSSASKSERFSPEYRVPQHNKKAASEVSVEIITNDLAEGDTSSTAEIEIHIVDINHGVATGTALDEMLADSSVGGITIEIPGIELESITVDVSSPTGSGHDPSDPLIYSALITNTASGIDGLYPGLVKVLDSYSAGLNESPVLNGMDGIGRVNPIETPLAALFNITEFATYAMFEILVSPANQPPVADIVPESFQITYQGDTIVWDATASYDTDGLIIQYEWDFDIPDGDPLNFISDALTIPPASLQESEQYNDAGSFYAAVRVTDNLGATDIAVISFDVLEGNYQYWTQFMGNKHHNGQTIHTGPQTNNVVWTYDTSGSQPFIVLEGYDGTIYHSTSQGGRLDAVNPDGTEKWIFTPSVPASWVNSMGVTPDNSILYVSVNPTSGAEYIAGLDTSDGTELWTFNLRCTNANYGLVLDNGDLVASGSTNPSGSDICTARIDKQGNEIWSCSTGPNFTTGPTQGLNGDIYARSNDSIVAINPDTGVIVNTYITNNHNIQTVTAVRSDGSVVFAGNDGSNAKMFCLDAELNEIWNLPMPGSIPIRGLGIGLNDEIYITYSNALYAIASDGSQVDWTWYNASSISSPAIDSEGTIYIGTISGAAAFNPDGVLKWQYNAPDGYGCAPMIAHDGSLYVNISSVLHKFEDL